MEENLEPNSEVNNEISDNTTKSNSEEIKVSKSETINNSEKEINISENSIDSKKDPVSKIEIKNDNDSDLKKDPVSKVEIKNDNDSDLKKDPVSKVEIKNDNDSDLKKDPVSKVEIKNDNDSDLKKDPVSKVEIKNDNDPTNKPIPKLKKELPIEKKPFQEFINIHLIPSLIQEINQRGLEINNINLENTNRPIAGDKCWVINCEIKDVCNFWLSFEKEDISSLKSISLSKPNQKPSIIESFLIDEKKITLKLIISRVLQRLNGQKLIGVN